MLLNKTFRTKDEEEKYKNKIRDFILSINIVDYDKEELERLYMRASRVTAGYRSEVFRLKRAIESWDNKEDLNNCIEIFSTKYTTKAELLIGLQKAENELNEWMELCETLDKIRNENKNFNKSICFSNIRELLKDNQDVKIGQIEKEAGVGLGYMSRLEKGDNTAEPSVEFIVTASKMLNVSMDTLIYMDITGLTSTEKFLVNFFEKLKIDTLEDNLNWNIETKFDLDRCEIDCNGNSNHPLFTLETFYRQSECEYPDEVTENIYVSKTFGPNTTINGDCYNLRLKNGAIFYLMDIVKDVHSLSDKSAFVKEAVMYVPRGGGIQVLATSKDDYPIGKLLDELFIVVKENMKHPKVNNDAMYAIKAFMNNDLSDDPDELPF